MTALVSATTNLPVPALVTTIKALIVKYDQATDKAEQYAVTLGLRLKELKDKKPDDVAWAAYVEKKVGLGRSRADNLIAIADGRTTVERDRAGAAERQQRKRQQEEKPPLRHGGNNSQSVHYPKTGITIYQGNGASSDDDDEELDDPAATDERRKAAFIMRANQAQLYAEYDGPADDHVTKAASRAAQAWSSTTNKLRRRK